MVNGKKVTGDIAETVRFAKGMEETRNFLVKQQGWSNEQFDEVDWVSLHLALGNKADGYKTWLYKQHSGFCGTGVVVGHYSGEEEADVSCPNCGCRVTAEHLCVYVPTLTGLDFSEKM